MQVISSSRDVPDSTGLMQLPCRGPATIVHLYVSTIDVGSNRNLYAEASSAKTCNPPPQS